MKTKRKVIIRMLKFIRFKLKLINFIYYKKIHGRKQPKDFLKALEAMLIIGNKLNLEKKYKYYKEMLNCNYYCKSPLKSCNLPKSSEKSAKTL